MMDPLRRAALLTACGLVLAGPAGAKLPSVANSTLGPVLVTDFAYSPAIPTGLTTCLRDVANNPIPYVTVTVDFSTCGSSVEMAAIQEDPEAVGHCAGETISKSSDSDACLVLGPFLARTSIDVPGWSGNPGSTPVRNIGPSSTVLCATLWAGGVLMGTVPVHVVRYDSDGDADVDAGDMGFTLDAVGHFLMGSPPNPPYRTFYDYDWDGDVDAGDAAAVLEAMGLYFQGVRAPYQGAYCP